MIPTDQDALTFFRSISLTYFNCEIHSAVGFPFFILVPVRTAMLLCTINLMIHNLMIHLSSPGKALGMSTRQSAVAIYDASGAFEHFKAIATFISRFDEAAATAAEAAEAAAGKAVGDNAAAAAASAAAATALSAPLPRERPSVGGKVAAATAASSGPAHRSPGASASERK